MVVMQEDDYIDSYEMTYRRDIEEYFEMTKDRDLSSSENNLFWMQLGLDRKCKDENTPSVEKDPTIEKIEKRIEEWKNLIDK